MVTSISGTLGQSTPFGTVSELIAKWPTAAQQQRVQLFGTAFDGYTTNYNDPTAISNLTLATNENPKSWLSYGNTYGIGVPGSYEGWFTDTRKIRAEINYDPNTNQTQKLTVRFPDNQTITEAFIDLEAFAAKATEKYGTEVGFLQAYKDGVVVPISAVRVSSADDLNYSDDNQNSIQASPDGITFTADSANPLDDTDFKFKIFGDFDELVFSAKPYVNPDPNIPTYQGKKTDSSDYLVQQITYKGFEDTPTPLKPVVFVDTLDPTASESGLPDGGGTFQFSRTGGDINQPLTIRYTVTGTATPGTDYGALSGTVTIAAGRSVSDPVTFTPVNDTTNEPNETVVVKVAEDLPYQVGSKDTASVSIRDDDPLTNTPLGAGPVLRYNSSGAYQFSYPNITAAVVAASANDIIVAQPGTYDEPSTVTIDKPLTLRGPNAGVSPNDERGSSQVSPAIVRTAAFLPVMTILPGISTTIEGLRIQMNGNNANAIRYQGGGNSNTNIVVRQNEFTGIGPATGGVVYTDFDGGTGSSATIVDNLIRDVQSGSVTSGIQTFRVDNARITDNTIANLTGPGVAADALTGSSSVINSNLISNVGQQGIQLAGGNATIENNDITNTNTSQGVDRAGIRLRNSGLTSAILGTVNVRSNRLTNSYNGLAIANDVNVANTVKVNYNNFVGNTNTALYHGGTGTLDATNNWWDDVNGAIVGGTGRNHIGGPGAAFVTSNPYSTNVF